MSSRSDALRAYFGALVVKFDSLEDERLALLEAATRIPEIQAEKAALIADAQEALDKYNAIEGTSFTLTQARQWYKRPSDR